MQVQVELPDSANVDPGYVREAVMAVLYATGKLSAHQACQILNLTCRAFDEMLPVYGFLVLVDSDDNLDMWLSS